jgi:hypothetical protein
MQMNTEKVKQLAKDLRKEEPRPAHERLAGFEIAARCLDKCRASLVGWQGDYKFGCPMDQMFFQESGVDPDEFRDYVATGASDQEIESWIQNHANAAK